MREIVAIQVHAIPTLPLRRLAERPLRLDDS